MCAEDVERRAARSTSLLPPPVRFGAYALKRVKQFLHQRFSFRTCRIPTLIRAGTDKFGNPTADQYRQILGLQIERGEIGFAQQGAAARANRSQAAWRPVGE